MTETISADLQGGFAAGDLPAGVTPFRHQRHEWIGTDGTVWDLTDPASGLFLVQEGVEGLHLPPMSPVHRESPNLAGASYNGYRIEARPVTWVIYIYSDDTSEDFYDLDARFWKSLKIGSTGIWRVTLPDGSSRQLTCRVIPKGTHSYDRDPGAFGWQKYVVTMVADENPFWTVPTEVPGARLTLRDESQRNFFGGGAAGGSGPDFYISPHVSEMTSELENPGDEPLYPTYRLYGPLAEAVLVIDDRPYSIAANVGAQGWFEIATHPARFAIRDNTGANRITSVSDWDFSPIPPQTTVPFSAILNGDGGGRLVIDMPPLYHRAWG